MTWRDKFAPIIADVLAATRGKPEKEIRAALRAAFPAGPREYHPYKIWLDEIRVQRGLKAIKQRGGRLATKPAAGQGGLFTKGGDA